VIESVMRKPLVGYFAVTLNHEIAMAKSLPRGIGLGNLIFPDGRDYSFSTPDVKTVCCSTSCDAGIRSSDVGGSRSDWPNTQYFTGVD